MAMDISSLNKRESYLDYASDYKIGFSSYYVEKGEYLESSKKDENHVLFILRGEMLVSCNEFIHKKFKTGEMVFLPKSADYKWVTTMDSHVVELSFDNPLNIYDKQSMELLCSYCKDIKYTFKSLQIRPVLSSYLQFIDILLKDGLNSHSLHEVKQKELFMILRAYYSKEELAEFFLPIIGKNLDFKSLVMENYMKVKNISEFAALTGCSVSTFKNRFKKNFDEPVYHWMLKQKSKHILHALSIKNMDFATITREFGFSSLSHFNRFCKIQYGVTPTEVRRKILGNIL